MRICLTVFVAYIKLVFIMKAHLSKSAANDVIWLIQDSYFGGLCSWSETASRLAALATLCKPGDPASVVASRVLEMQNFAIEDDWPTDEGESARATSKSGGSNHSLIQNSNPDWLDDDEPPILQFIADAAIGLSDWHFHQADPDFFPSVPHGHWQGNDQPKLDPYTGYIYQGLKQTSRVSRKKTVALWNDCKFRVFARAAVNYYLAAFPRYRGWRVPNPRRLPRRR